MSTPIKGKSRNKFESILCCWCFSKKKSQGDSDIYLGDDNEPYEYVLEKLAIKKVPVRLLTLAGDFPKKQSGNSDNSSSTHSVSPTYLEEKPSVSFSSYYKLQNSERIDDQVSQSSKDRKSLSFNDNVQEKEIVATALPIFPSRQTMTESQSKAIVADVLNKHSSLYTLGKDPIPKDPSHLPSNRTIVPPSVKHAISKQERAFPSRIPVYEREVYAEIHHIPNKKSSLKDPFPPNGNRNDMAPSIQNTIDSLKYTQKPHLPGIPPKNQRSMKTSITDSSSEKEFYCIAPIHEIAETNMFHRSAGTHSKMFTNQNVKNARDYETGTNSKMLTNQNVKSARDYETGTNSKMFTNQNVKNACDYEINEINYNKLHRESSERDKHFPFQAQSRRDTVVEQTDHWYPQERKYVEYDNKKKVFTVPAEDEFHGPYHLRRSEYYNPKYLKFDDEVDDERGKANRSSKDKNKNKSKDNDKDTEKDNNRNNEKDQDMDRDRDKDRDNKNQSQNTSRREMVDDEQITDVRSKQGQNLKWKIIVKHHQDKSDGKAGETVKETSGSVAVPRRR